MKTSMESKELLK